MPPLRARLLIPAALAFALGLPACSPDSSPRGDVAASPRGQVSVSSDVALEQWIPPQVTVTADNAHALLQQAETAAQEQRWFLEPDSVLPIALAVLNSPQRSPAEREHAERLRRAAIAGMLRDGQRRLPLLDSNPMALAEATAIAAAIRVGAPGDASTYGFLDAFERRRTAALLNAQAQDLVDRGDYGDSPDQGAQQLFRQALETDPDSETAKSGLANIEQLLIIRAMNDADSRWYNLATVALRRAAQVRNDSEGLVAQARRDIESNRIAYLQNLRDVSIAGLQTRDGLKSARENLVEMIRVAPSGNPLVAELSTRIDLFAHYGPYRPGENFRDDLSGGGKTPLMLVIPHGAFVMGSADSDPAGQKNERPAHEIRFARGFALGQYEVTVAEFGKFVYETKYRTRASRRGFSTVYSERTGNYSRQSFVDWYSDYHGNRAAMNAPVMHVSARDAQAYVDWLSEQTGKNYRLPSEAEFEYANRAGSTTTFPWGEGTPLARIENLTGLLDESESGRHWQNGFAGYSDGFWGPAPTGSFAPNGFGLHDIGGNLSEWTADCIHASFRRAPADGKAWVNSGCRSFVSKGGSWASSPEQTRSAFRIGTDADTTNARMGFRVARDL